jgi:uncharacterized protein YbjT (DUF2867 family)
MKLVIIGGGGLIGRKLVGTLRRDGHDVGLDEALAGAQVVIHVATPASWNDAAVLETFQTSSRNLLSVEAAVGVAHHVALSVVGADRLPDNGYFRAKVAQEEAVRAGLVPYTIVRATQLFEDIRRIVESSSDGDTVRLSPALVQPVAADDVASALADVAVGTALEDTIELAGPRAFPLCELGRRVLVASGDPRLVTADVHARYFGAELDDSSLIPSDGARIAPTRFEDWLSQSSNTR